MKLRWFVGLAFMMTWLFLSTSIAQGQHVLRYVTSDSSEIAVPLNDQGSPQPSGAAEIPLWTSSFEYDGTSYSFTMVGSDPSVPGAGTTNVPGVIVPLRFKFGSTIISPGSKACGDTVPVLSRVRNSPLFSDVTWTDGRTVVGKTQFADAFQRANFWNSVSNVSPNYHVALKPVTVAKALTVEVPAGQGSVAAGPCAGHHVGTVSSAFWLNYLLGSIGNLSATSLTILLAYDVGVAEPSGAVFPLQGHGARLPSAPTFVVGSFGEGEVFQPDAPDILSLSKGLGAWIDDPQITNSVPAWGHIGVVKACYSRLEDPLPAPNSFSAIQSGFTYHVAELTFLSWFARQNPSEAVNGWYSTRNSLAGPQPVCQRDLGEF